MKSGQTSTGDVNGFFADLPGWPLVSSAIVQKYHDKYNERDHLQPKRNIIFLTL